MKVFKNELSVHRNESFTINKLIENRDGSPYIISSELNNPYWLVTITNTLYEQEGRYVYNKWLNLKNSLRFVITKPVDLSSLGYTSWDAVLPAGYEGDETSGYANIAVFYLTINGKREYKYWQYYNDVADDYSGDWVTYSCRISTSFHKQITKDWVEQNYYYGILLVSGNLISDSSKPIEVDTVYSILSPTRIFVQSNLKGGM